MKPHSTDIELRILAIQEYHYGMALLDSEAFGRLETSLKREQMVQLVSVQKLENYADEMISLTQHFVQRDKINTIFIDPLSIIEDENTCNRRLEHVTRFIFMIREQFPEIVFVLYTYFDKLHNRQGMFYEGERARFAHYFKLNKKLEGDEFDLGLNSILTQCRAWIGLHQHQYEYDVALSFAGEERDYADKLAQCLHRRGIRVFYDSFEQANLWGKDLYTYLHTIYKKKAKYCVIFVSTSYATKMWTVHERKSAQERALWEREKEYILPIKIDDIELPGLPSTISYLNIDIGITNICKMLITKIG